LRIAHVAHAFPPYSRAGAENYAEALALAQLRRHEVCVFHRVADEGRSEYELWEDRQGLLPAVRINRTFRDLDRFEGTYRNEAVAEAFGSFLDRFRPDLVHFHHVTCLSTTCVDAAADRGIPIVFTLHDFWLLCPRGQLLRRDPELSLCENHSVHDCVACMAPQLRLRAGHARTKAIARRASRLLRWKLPVGSLLLHFLHPWRNEREARSQIVEREQEVHRMCERVDLFIAPSVFIARAYQAFGIDTNRLAVSDYGFDLGPWKDAPKRKGDPEGRLRVAYLGTWIPPKGVHVLLEAFERLDPGRFWLHLHGHAVPYDGSQEYEKKILRIAERSPHVSVEGAYAPEQIPALLSQADVLVVPSIWYENSPLTIHEGFLAGIPVIVSAQGGMQELVQDGVTGLTFKPRDAVGLAQAIRRLRDEPGLWERLASARPRVKNIEENAKELEEFYVGLASGRRAKAVAPALPRGVNTVAESR